MNNSRIIVTISDACLVAVALVTIFLILTYGTRQTETILDIVMLAGSSMCCGHVIGAKTAIYMFK